MPKSTQLSDYLRESASICGSFFLLFGADIIDVAIPNDETIKALEDSRNGRDLERFDSVEELFESWNA